jgi:hypothetical protein
MRRSSLRDTNVDAELDTFVRTYCILDTWVDSTKDDIRRDHELALTHRSPQSTLYPFVQLNQPLYSLYLEI